MNVQDLANITTLMEGEDIRDIHRFRNGAYSVLLGNGGWGTGATVGEAFAAALQNVPMVEGVAA